MNRIQLQKKSFILILSSLFSHAPYVFRTASNGRPCVWSAVVKKIPIDLKAALPPHIVHFVDARVHPFVRSCDQHRVPHIFQQTLKCLLNDSCVSRSIGISSPRQIPPSLMRCDVGKKKGPENSKRRKKKKNPQRPSDGKNRKPIADVREIKGPDP